MDNNNKSDQQISSRKSQSANNNNAATTTTLFQHQPSYCGQKLRLKCEILSPVCRQYTVEPETPVYKFAGGLVGLVDLIVIVFALGSQLPSLLQNNNPLAKNSTSTTTTSPYVLSTPIILCIAFLIARILYHVFVARVPAERLTVIRGVGCQLNRQSSSSLFGTWGSTELIDVATITSCVIHEGYLRHRVVYFLAIACQDRPSLILPFSSTLPQLAVLRVILRGVRAVLYGEVEEGLSLGELDYEMNNQQQQQQQQSTHDNNNKNVIDDEENTTNGSNSQISKSDEEEEEDD